MKIHPILRLLTALATLFAGAVAAIATDSAQATPPVSLTGEKAVAQLKESGQYASIAAAYQAARHAVRPDVAEPEGVFHAQNPGHGLSATFDRHGLQLAVKRHGSEGERLTTRWRLASVGREGAVAKVPAGDALRRDGQRAEIVRAGLGLTEWFVNRPSGLEHGFTLDRRPVGDGALRLDIAIEGDLSPVPTAGGQRIELHDAAGAKVLDYEKLRVWDAAGREMPARMERAAAGGLRFQVEDAGARYPLTIDPAFVQMAYLKASNAGAGDRFGTSVAISGDTVVIGAPGEASGSTGVNSTPNKSADAAGAAYVFTRSDSTWSQQAYLKPAAVGTTQEGDQFGVSVAVSGDTVVIGAPGEASGSTGINSTPNESADAAGAAYIFTPSAATWTEQAYVKANNAGADDRFGVSVAVDGDTVIVGAPQENTYGTDAGMAYALVRSGTNWTQPWALSGGFAGVRSGESVAISGDTVVLGIPLLDVSAPAGAAAVFVVSGGIPTQQALLMASNPGGATNSVTRWRSPAAPSSSGRTMRTAARRTSRLFHLGTVRVEGQIFFVK